MGCRPFASRPPLSLTDARTHGWTDGTDALFAGPPQQTIVRDRLQAAREEIRHGLGPGGEGYVVLKGFLRDGDGEGEGRLCRNMREEALALFKCV